MPDFMKKIPSIFWAIAGFGVSVAIIIIAVKLNHVETHGTVLELRKEYSQIKENQGAMLKAQAHIIRQEPRTVSNREILETLQNNYQKLENSSGIPEKVLEDRATEYTDRSGHTYKWNQYVNSTYVFRKDMPFKLEGAIKSFAKRTVNIVYIIIMDLKEYAAKADDRELFIFCEDVKELISKITVYIKEKDREKNNSN